MSYGVLRDLTIEKRAMRDVYCDTLIELATKNDKVIGFDADLMNSVGMVKFGETFPERMINCGIQEANMIGMASGSSAVGLIPFVHTFACFAARRTADQVFVSAAFAQANIRIIGSDPGVTAAFNGATHMPFEDVGIMRGFPTVTIIEPTDTVMLADVIRQLEKLIGVYYIRLSRKNVIGIYEDGSTFEIGKGALLKDGMDVTLIASGIMVSETMKAAEKLEQLGISTRVINIYTIKPIDKEIIITAANETGAIVTAENHNYINGLGSAVAEVLAENRPVPMARIGVEDQFGQVGSVEYLKEIYGLTADNIVEKALKTIKRK
ncbi:transketolase family protein [Enterococcus sp. CWB-B31]|uniref:transketolase family protein n=1 Tax=Enterococcus sp. CWB-B31 TaxID=2885159 RepID=UPI001E62FC57|nr:transketolase C-terminal domain-containing protein [Enterococcus sp. CWB-B31]MCB5955361.1 transketolase family protein [Enterococcus sp. CWB-B31]